MRLRSRPWLPVEKAPRIPTGRGRAPKAAPDVYVKRADGRMVLRDFAAPQHDGKKGVH